MDGLASRHLAAVELVHLGVRFCNFLLEWRPAAASLLVSGDGVGDVVI